MNFSLYYKKPQFSLKVVPRPKEYDDSIDYKTPDRIMPLDEFQPLNFTKELYSQLDKIIDELY
jgi:hypothetical protein